MVISGGDSAGGGALSRVQKEGRPVEVFSADLRSVDLRSVDQGRRDFLIRCCQGASVALFPAGLRGLAFPSANPFASRNALQVDSEFQLHPHYRSLAPLDATPLKSQSGIS